MTISELAHLRSQKIHNISPSNSIDSHNVVVTTLVGHSPFTSTSSCTSIMSSKPDVTKIDFTVDL